MVHRPIKLVSTRKTGTGRMCMMLFKTQDVALGWYNLPFQGVKKGGG